METERVVDVDAGSSIAVESLEPVRPLWFVMDTRTKTLVSSHDTMDDAMRSAERSARREYGSMFAIGNVARYILVDG